MRPTHLVSSLLALTLTLGAASCGGSADPGALTSDGQAALGASDWKGALADFEAALEGIGGDTSNPNYVTASLGAVQAKLHLDPETARADFLALSERVSLGDRDFSFVGSKFANAGEYVHAAHILDAGIQAHPESPSLEALKTNIIAAAENDSDLANVLEGLGYL